MYVPPLGRPKIKKSFQNTKYRFYKTPTVGTSLISTLFIFCKNSLPKQQNVLFHKIKKKKKFWQNDRVNLYFQLLIFIFVETLTGQLIFFSNIGKSRCSGPMVLWDT